MNQALNPGLEFHERAEIEYAGHGATSTLARLVFCRHRIPRIRLKLLHAHRNALFFRVNLENLDFDLLPCREDICRLADAASGDVADMQ